MLVSNESESVLRKDGGDAEFEPWCEPAEVHSTGADRGDLRRYLTALYRRRWMVLGVLVLTLTCAALYCLIATPIYEARVKLLIESESPNVVSFKEVIEQNTGKLDYYETQLGILRSRTLARKTLDGLQLWNYPEFTQEPTALRRLAANVLSPMIARRF